MDRQGRMEKENKTLGIERRENYSFNEQKNYMKRLVRV